MNCYCLFLVFFLINYVSSNADGQCCRRRIECFECDSRFDPRCGDNFNLTRDTGTLIYCDDLCIKLKHRFGNQFYYIRSCADQFKKIYIKKTSVCYSTRTNDGGHLCFCDHDLCNNALTLRLNFTSVVECRTRES
ncbi:quiver isoform X1 [Brachionus plicatilis]|uniref:UPAR/Ly6 domain-containing protein qvr n=1 Tax=Brachionus plicatilis TaxID=10195 RepID=A0A3M7QDN3_BRAPC|nr:quiver isoform X1 [Brachionus plicatilis]